MTTKKYIITEEQASDMAKHLIVETAYFDVMFDKIISFLNKNYKQAQQQESNGLEYQTKPVVTKIADDKSITLARLLDYLEYKFKVINPEFLKQCIVDWYNGTVQNEKRLSKNIVMFKEDVLKKENSLLVEHYFNPDKIFTGDEVNQHIEAITPNEDDLPFYFMNKLIKPRKFKLHEIDINNLLNSDADFKEYYESGFNDLTVNQGRYDDDDEVSNEDLYHELVVVDGELLDGYSRASTLLRNGDNTTMAFVAI